MNTAERITNELIHEQASIWYINDTFGAKVMVKVNASVIKSIYKGAKLEFLFGLDNIVTPAVFHKGLRIHDDPVHFLSLTGINRFEDEHTSLAAIMNRNFTYIHFHDELSVCVATAKLSFDVKDQLKVSNLLGNVKNLFIGDFNTLASNSLDCFDHSLKMQRDFTNVHEIDTVIISGNVSDWQVMNNTFVGIKGDDNNITIDAKDEGSILEQQVQVILDSLFLSKIHRNPQINIKNKFRELTDIFAHYDNGIFLIETKALGMLNASEEKGMDRKVSGVQKQISKGIGQLTGAVKKIHSGVTIYDNNKSKIEFKKVILPHCVILVSELFPFGDWKEIEYRMFKAMTETNMYLNVMDLREFMQYVGNAHGNKDLFNLMLIERVEKLVEHRSIHMKLNVIKENPESSQ